MSFYQGQLVQVSGSFTDANNAPLDPSTVKITVVRPDGQSSTYVYGVDAVVVKDSTGNYHLNVAATVPGTWTYWWHSEGTGQAADEKTFLVKPAKAADAGDPAQSLQIDFAQLRRAVGRFLGIGRDPADWQPNEKQDVQDILRSGLRRFYWPPPLPVPDGQRPSAGYSWSFLRPVASLDIKTSTTTYDLPVDFGELIDGGFTYGAGIELQNIAIVGEETIRQLQSQSPQTGDPKYAAIRPKAGKLTQYEVVFYPTPTADRTLTYRYSVSPQDLSDDFPYPRGGALHSETILEACLAAAEKTLQDDDGIHEQRFLQCLARSITADQNLTQLADADAWPLEDQAKDLGVTKAYLKRLIGRELGYGPHPAVWTHKQSEEIKLVLESGLRKFYAPPVLPGERWAWEWSFLCPLKKLLLSSSVYEYDLPPGFVSIQGPMTFAPETGYYYHSIDIVGEHQIRTRLQRSLAAGRPQLAAVRMKNLDPTGGTAWEVLFCPPPDQEYEVQFRYHVNADMIPEDSCLPYGGQQHAQTIIEACLAAAEEYQGKPAVHSKLFMERLQRSVSGDRLTNAPDTLGQNRDRSDRPMMPMDATTFSWHDCDANVVTYNGVMY